MTKGRSVSILSTWVWLVILFLFTNDHQAASLHLGQEIVPDTVKSTIQEEGVSEESSASNQTLTPDSVSISGKERASIEAMVERTAVDSIVQDIINRKVYLYGDAVVNYEDITLKAAVIEVDFATNTVFAYGLEDSTGKIKGSPEFTEGKATFKAKKMSYNFDTKKGIIQEVLTEDDQGFLHGKKVKKMDDNTINVLHGSYTTCNLEENPHFAFKFKKSRVIPDNKIVTGPAYMEIEGVPTILALPFWIPDKMCLHGLFVYIA